MDQSDQPRRASRQAVPRDDPRYQPTKAEMEEEVRIDATPDELLLAVMGRRPRAKSD